MTETTKRSEQGITMTWRVVRRCVKRKEKKHDTFGPKRSIMGPEMSPAENMKKACKEPIQAMFDSLWSFRNVLW